MSEREPRFKAVPEQNESESSGTFENLTTEQIEVLKTLKVEILEEHPQIVYCESKGEERYSLDTFLHGSREKMSQSGIRKPMVVVKRRENEDIPTLNEMLDKLSERNFFQKYLEEYPNIRFSRDAVSAAKLNIGEPPIEKSNMTPICHREQWTTIDYGKERVAGGTTIINLPDSLQKRARYFANIFVIYTYLVEAEQIADEGLKVRNRKLHEATCLKDEESFKNAWDKAVASEGLISLYNDFLEEVGGHESLRKHLVDYRDHFFPGKFEEMAKLQDEINDWLRSLKTKQ